MEGLSIRKMQKAVHELAKTKGWHSSPDMEETISDFEHRLGLLHSTSSIEEITEDRKRIVREILSCRFTSPEDKIPQMLINIAGEVLEAWEEYRANRKPTEVYFETDKQGNQKPLGIPTELADVVIRCMDTAEALGIDLQSAILQKHRYNATRPHRHGNKRA
jgi:NTP pyrophosphatase (non-canonical NTP hydrolase)